MYVTGFQKGSMTLYCIFIRNSYCWKKRSS